MKTTIRLTVAKSTSEGSVIGTLLLIFTENGNFTPLDITQEGDAVIVPIQITIQENLPAALLPAINLV